MPKEENENSDANGFRQSRPQGVRGDRGYHPEGSHVQPGTAITVGEQNEIIMKFVARPGDEVIACVGNDFRQAIRVPMIDENSNGTFTAVLKGHGLVGPQMINFYVNGIDVLNKSASQMWYLTNSLHNYVELPDPETDALIEARREIAHGAVTHDFYYSETFNKWVNSTVYTPPGYEQGAVQAAYIRMRNTDAFGSMGMFTAFWISSFYHAQGKDDPFYTAAEKIAAHPEEVKVFFHSEGDMDAHYHSVEAENEMFALLGIDKLSGYVFKTYHASHNWSSYRRAMRDFAPLLFKE